VLKALLESRAEILRWLADRRTLAAAVWLTVGLGTSVFVVWAFAELADGVVEGESRRFDRAVLLWIDSHSPEWLDGPMLLATTLGYYWVVVPLLAVSVLVFYLRGWRLSAVLLLVSTVGSFMLTTVLKAVFERSRPDLIDSGYTATFYSFPSGHATVAAGFYGALTLIVAGSGAVGRRCLRHRAGVTDRLLQALPRGPLPDGRAGRVPRRAPVAGLRRGRLCGVALGPGPAGGGVAPEATLRKRAVENCPLGC
jgi:membrane-associated phospholipid phosphatase